MKIEEIKDWCNEYSRFINLVDFIGKDIYYIENTLQVLKYHIDSMQVNKIDYKIYVEYLCKPVSSWLGTPYETILIDREEFYKRWFLTLEKAKQTAYIMKCNRLTSLF